MQVTRDRTEEIELKCHRAFFPVHTNQCRIGEQNQPRNTFKAMSQNNEDSSPIPAIKDEAKELLALAISTGTLVLSAVLMARGARNMSTIQPYANMNHWIKTTGMVTHTPYYQVRASERQMDSASL